MKKTKAVAFSLASLCFVFAILISCLNVFSAQVVIDTNKPASLGLAYRDGNTPITGVNVRIYRVADVNSKKVFTLTGAFKGLPVEINNLDTTNKMHVAAQTLAAYAVVDNIKPYAEVKTDKNGVIKLENLKPGLFLVVSDNKETDNLIYKFSPFLVELPEVDQYGNVNYTDVFATPKKEEFNPNNPGEKTELLLSKRWVDTGNEDKRPRKIDVVILKNGEVFDEVTLSGENRWTYKWNDYGGANIWQAVEKNVPDGYVFSLNVGKNTLLLYNTYKEDETTTEEETTRPGETTKPGETLPGETTKPGETLPGGTTKPGETLPGGTTKPGETLPGGTTKPGDDPSHTSGGTTEPTGNVTKPTGEENTTERLPQTGQLWWPVPLLATLGLLLFAFGFVLTSKEKV